MSNCLPAVSAVHAVHAACCRPDPTSPASPLGFGCACSGLLHPVLLPRAQPPPCHAGNV